MKKTLLFALILTAACSLMAGPPGYRYRYYGPPPHHYHHHHYHGGNDGVRLAADIVGLVGASMNLLAPRPVIVTPAPAPYVQPVYTAPAPYVQPVYTQPVPYVQPVQPVQPQTPVVNKTTVIVQPAQTPAAPATGRASGYDPHGYNLP